MLKIFGTRLKELRTERRLTQAQISAELGIHSVTYRHYEKNQREPSLELLVTIAKYYDVSTDYLLGLSDI